MWTIKILLLRVGFWEFDFDLRSDVAFLSDLEVQLLTGRLLRNRVDHQMARIQNLKLYLKNLVYSLIIDLKVSILS